MAGSDGVASCASLVGSATGSGPAAGRPSAAGARCPGCSVSSPIVGLPRVERAPGSDDIRRPGAALVYGTTRHPAESMGVGGVGGVVGVIAVVAVVADLDVGGVPPTVRA